MAHPSVNPRDWTETLPSVSPARAVSQGPGSLESNESVLPPSPAAVVAMAQAATRFQLYPHADSGGLRETLADRLDLAPGQILLGNGSEEVLYLLLNAFAGRGGTVLVGDPACGVHERLIRRVGASAVRVPLRDWTHDLAAMVETPADVAIICNPHNPTGTSVSSAQMAAFLARRAGRGLTIVDEAYAEFADDVAALTSMKRVAADPGLVVVRTFSKVYGLAGARVGYCAGAAGVIQAARRLQLSFPVNAIAQAAATAALADAGYTAMTAAKTRANRDSVTTLLTQAGYEVVPSQANFVFIVTPDEAELLARLEKGGVTARPGKAMGVPGTVRLTVPSDEGLELVAKALEVS